jgi:hypothetical protein
MSLNQDNQDNEERIKHFGSKMFYLRTIDEYCNQTENLKTSEQWFQYINNKSLWTTQLLLS